jgi:hypothetical protein
MRHNIVGCVPSVGIEGFSCPWAMLAVRWNRAVVTTMTSDVTVAWTTYAPESLLRAMLGSTWPDDVQDSLCNWC